MELRVLNYFLTVAREESITKAANALHLSQPTLSRQLMDLEEELGKQLFLRGKRKITLTEEGRILKARAEEIMAIVHKAENEITAPEDSVAGDVHVGAGETEGFRFLAKAFSSVRARHPGVHFHIFSGDTGDVLEALDKGLIDFGLVFGEHDETRHHQLTIPYRETWGVLMRNDAPLAKKKRVSAKDLYDLPMIVSRAVMRLSSWDEYLGIPADRLNIAGSYSLLFNASILAQEGLGYVVCLDNIVNTTGTSLVFRPLKNNTPAPLRLIRKRHQVFSRASEAFLAAVREMVQSR